MFDPLIALLPASPPVQPTPREGPQRLSRRNRFAIALAAGTATTGLFSAVLLSFDAAAPSVWLAPSPQVMELAADCDRKPDRSNRERCRRLLPQDMAALREARKVSVAQR